MLSSEQVLDDKLLRQVLDSPYSRVPVFSGDDRSDVLGMLLVRQVLRRSVVGDALHGEGETLQGKAGGGGKTA